MGCFPITYWDAYHHFLFRTLMWTFAPPGTNSLCNIQHSHGWDNYFPLYRKQSANAYFCYRYFSDVHLGVHHFFAFLGVPYILNRIGDSHIKLAARYASMIFLTVLIARHLATLQWIGTFTRPFFVETTNFVLYMAYKTTSRDTYPYFGLFFTVATNGGSVISSLRYYQILLGFSTQFVLHQFCTGGDSVPLFFSRTKGPTLWSRRQMYFLTTRVRVISQRRRICHT